MTKIDYAETPRAYLQRALDDLSNAREALASSIAVPNDSDIKWTLRTIEEHMRKATEHINYYRHEVNK